MEHVGHSTQSSADLLSSIISLCLLDDPPSPSSTLSIVLQLIADKKPFLDIESNSQILRQWNTRVSSLIQSKSVESRYWGVNLAKATVSNGGEGVNHAIVWTKLLITLLNRPEASVLLERVIPALISSFGLISTHPQLSRELNNLLPNFVTTLLNLASNQSLLPAILQALHDLIPEHAKAFRQNFGRIQQLSLSLIDGSFPIDIKRLAAKVYVDLHHCAPKGTGRDHWRSSLLATISEIHSVLDILFEVVEEGRPQLLNAYLDQSKLPRAKGLGLKPLEVGYRLSLFAGIDRISVLVMVIEEFLSLPTKQPVNVPLGHLVDLALRIYSIDENTRPRENVPTQNISLLLSILSSLYHQMNTLILATVRWELSSLVSSSISGDHSCRISIYNLTSCLLHEFGAGLHSHPEAKRLESFVNQSLSDIATLIATTSIPTLSTSTKSRKRKHGSDQTFHRIQAKVCPTAQILAAIQLVTVLLRLTPFLTLSIRSSIDQVILSVALSPGLSPDVLCELHRAIVASVQFPAGIAVLPHALRILERDLAADIQVVRDSAACGLGEMEWLIHPRLPPQKRPVPRHKTSSDGDEDNEERATHMTTDEPVVEKTIVEPIFEAQPENLERGKDAEVSESPIDDTPRPPLPSFVAGPEAQVSLKTTQNSAKEPRPMQEEPSQSLPVRVIVSQGIEKNLNIGPWTTTYQQEDEEDEAIPEIDMEFDSDEE